MHMVTVRGRFAWRAPAFKVHRHLYQVPVYRAAARWIAVIPESIFGKCIRIRLEASPLLHISLFNLNETELIYGRCNSSRSFFGA